MTGDPLPREDNVSRYCRPGAVDKGLPMAAAFEPKTGEEYLSVNWLEFFGAQDLKAAVDCVRDAFLKKGYRVRPKGAFATLNVGAAINAVSEAAAGLARIEHLPLANDESHSGIFGYTADDKFAVAVGLKLLITAQDVHPAKRT